jgi:predicted alpha/beta-hydrolase family hydrolase
VPETRDVETPHGPARVHVHAVEEPRAVLMLGHGAGGGVGAPDLAAATHAALEQRVSVVLVEQPYRVAGRRSPAPAAQLDAAWVAVADEVRTTQPLVVGGRSSGARVACRTAPDVDAAGVLCLAFPLLPPRRASGAEPVSRLGELDAVAVPVLVVQGENDRFGMPPAAPSRTVVAVRGDHALRSDRAGVTAAVSAWLEALIAG